MQSEANRLEAQTLLIRLISHPTNNPHLIDKLIILKGIPYDWVFKKAKYRIENTDGSIDEGVSDQLLTPWEPDVDVNIPKEVRTMTESITFLRWFPDVRHGDKTFRGFWTKETVWGLRIDYGYGPAQEMWTKIEEFIYQALPRAEKMPEAVQVAADQKSPFKTFLARRGRNQRSIELLEMDVPIVDLRQMQPTLVTTAQVAPVIESFKTVIPVPADPSPPLPESPKPSETLFECDVCKKPFDKRQALSMHKVGAHLKKVKV